MMESFLILILPSHFFLPSLKVTNYISEKKVEKFFQIQHSEMAGCPRFP